MKGNMKPVDTSIIIQGYFKQGQKELFYFNGLVIQFQVNQDVAIKLQSVNILPWNSVISLVLIAYLR